MSADRILDKIIADAGDEAEMIIQSAKTEAARRRDAIKEALNLRLKEIEDKTEKEIAEIERRKMLSAGLESRKNTLSSRRKMVDDAFEKALEVYLNLSDSEYTKLVTNTVVSASETGKEKVFVPKGRESLYTGPESILTAINEALVRAGKTGELTYGGITPHIKGGVLLVGDIADIDCSFESLVVLFREEHEVEVAKMLFESGV
jgi:Archaeal/vacuolar-type H+-ATPase subunit E